MEEKIKERILYDAIQTAIRQRKTITMQRIVIAVLCVCIGIVCALRGV